MLIIKGKFLSNEKNIDVNFGENASLLKLYEDGIIEKTLKVKQLTTLIDALNFITYTGWEIVHLIPFSTNLDGGTYETYRYLMKRNYSDK
jgi:hypothetical protein